MKAEHSKEPWEPGSLGASLKSKTVIKSKLGRFICSTGGYSSNVDVEKVRVENEANAARIMQCVNACIGIADPETTVPELVKALDNICVLFGLKYDGSDTAGEILVKEARAVLAKVKGE